MKTRFGTLVVCGVLLGFFVAPTVHGAAPDMFVVRSTTKTPEAVVDAVKAYVEGKKVAVPGG